MYTFSFWETASHSSDDQKSRGRLENRGILNKFSCRKGLILCLINYGKIYTILFYCSKLLISKCIWILFPMLQCVFVIWYKALKLKYFVTFIDEKLDSCFWLSYFSVSWVTWLTWIVHTGSIVPDSYCDKERTVTSLMATTCSHHGYQSASPVAHSACRKCRNMHKRRNVKNGDYFQRGVGTCEWISRHWRNDYH